MIKKAYLVRFQDTFCLTIKDKELTSESLYDIGHFAAENAEWNEKMGEYETPFMLITTIVLSTKDWMDLIGYVYPEDETIIEYNHAHYGCMRKLKTNYYLSPEGLETEILREEFSTPLRKYLAGLYVKLGLRMFQPQLMVLPRKFTIIKDTIKQEARLCGFPVTQETLSRGYALFPDAPIFETVSEKEGWAVALEWINKHCPQLHP
jgi:hypothetical protein